MKIMESGENYLETILILKQKQGSVRSIDIVRELNFAKPSVSIAMKKLKESDYINIDADGYISLTSTGQKIASKVYERHTVLSEALIKIGVNEDLAREDACKIEHHISSETFEKIKDYVEKMKK